MGAKKTYFLSDTHLGASCHANPGEVERVVAAFLESIADDAGSLYLLGDILDYWYEYRNCVPQGFLRFFGALVRLADSGVKIYWYAGNHDVWFRDYLSREIGLEIVDPKEGGDVREIAGHYFFVGHGDGVENLSRSMRFVRKVFRNPVCKVLYSAVHPRWTIGFARGCSNESRSRGNYHHPENMRSKLTELLRGIGNAVVGRHPEVETVVMGHYHFPMEIELDGARKMIVLGAWDERGGCYGVFDGTEFLLKNYKSRLDENSKKTD